MKRTERYDTEYEDEFADILNADPSTIIDVDEDATPSDWCEPEATKRDIGLAPEPSEQTDDSTIQQGNPHHHHHHRRRRRKKRGSYIGQFFTGSVLSQDEFTRRLPVFAFVVLLMLLYIANGFHIQHKYSKLDEIIDDLKSLKTEAVTISSVRMTATRQSEIEKLLEQYDIPLTIDNTSPHIIED